MFLFLLIIIYISFISLGLPDSILGAAWPSIYPELGVHISYAGIASTITAIGTVISSLFSVKLIRRFGTGLVTAVSVLFTAAALLGISFSNSFIAICLLSLPLGLGGGSVDAALNNYVALHYKAKHMSWLHCFWGVGASLGPAILSFWLTLGSWNMGYRSIGIFQSVLVVILFLSLPIWRKAEGHYEKNSSEGKQQLLTFWEAIKLPGVKAALAVFFCYCSMEAMTGLWGSSFLVTARGIDAKTAAGWVSLFYLGITFGRFLSGFLTLKFNQRQMISIGLVIIGIGVLLLFIPGTKIFLLPGLFLVGLGCAPIFPSLIHETPLNFGAQNSQSIMGMQMASAYIGYLVTPPVFGFLASKLGYEIFHLSLAVLLILSVILIKKLHQSAKEATSI